VEGKQSVPFGQVIIGVFPFNGVDFIIGQRLIWGEGLCRLVPENLGISRPKIGTMVDFV